MLEIRRPSMEDNLQMEEDIKICKVEYISNHWLDLPQIFNLSSWDQTTTTQIRHQNMLNNSATNHWFDLPKILNINSGDQNLIQNVWNEEDFQ